MEILDGISTFYSHILVCSKFSSGKHIYRVAVTFKILWRWIKMNLIPLFEWLFQNTIMETVSKKVLFEVN